MTTSSTALVVVGPSGVGSFHARLWRISPNSAQLVEGGSSGPYFLVGSSDDEFIIRVDPFDPDAVARATVMALTVIVSYEGGLHVLRESENLVQTQRGERIAEFWELADDTLELLLTRLRLIARIGIIELDSSSILNGDVLQILAEYGLDVSIFRESINTRKSDHGAA